MHKVRLSVGFLSFSILLLFSPAAQARYVFQGMDFSSGDWALIGIPLHNYQFLPIQAEIGTFITRDRQFMESLQSWELPRTYEDKCDHHYTLKFYRGGELIRTYRLNLYCGYLSLDGWSYELEPLRFEQFRRVARPIDWSRISFGDLSLMKKAITTLERQEEVYWYDDVTPFQYSGFYMYGYSGLPWNTNLDSLDRVVNTQVGRLSGQSEYYVKRHFHIVRGNNLYVRYLIHCEPEIAALIPRQYKYLDWRSHLDQTDSVRVVAIGLDRERYKKLMRRQ